jgi:hypothetical protein
MSDPAGIQMNLERLLMEQKVKIVGVHSVVLVEDSIVDIIYDVVPDECGMGLNFRFALPRCVGRGDIQEFAVWLATDYVSTVH